MTTKERLQAEIEHLSEDDMADLLRIIQNRTQTGQNQQLSLMTKSITDVLAETPGHLAFQSAEEVDAYLRDERDAWEHQFCRLPAPCT